MPGLGYRLYDTKKNRPVLEDEYYLYKVDEKGKVQKYSYQLATEGPRLVPVYKDAPHIEVEYSWGAKDKNGTLIHEGDRCRFGSGAIRVIVRGNGAIGFYGTWDEFIPLPGHRDIDTILEGIEIVGNVRQQDEKEG